jgi:hypothetical protein
MIRIDLTKEEIELIINAIGWADGEGAYADGSEVTVVMTTLLAKLQVAVRP